MKLPTLLLDHPHYHEYVNGNEIEVDASLIQNKNVTEGDHVMVYRDSISSFSDVSLPRREKQSEYIGVEGEVTRVNITREPGHKSESIQSLCVKKI